ncbi:NADH-quinone oxidoreductase subunit M [Ktedonosporobacter rubrisoli]|uniref:NADH-quinone oxidoreductase subunit M n=1 Tax=Ktedonosporobacter rubrisoli TaxID=2509675 RepID=A0A4P6JUZ1_KTERU|nr:NADH-quinone oxidoreductase subunit M [Ktedonosporobacter rubrisoli]QBD79205.1 NADH-quinone oxidoreductase subunit M [Ktedonosporobacter rubrisoli]
MTIFSSILTWIILLPVIGAVVIYALPTKPARWVALGFAAATFVLSLVVVFTHISQGFGDLQHLAESINLPWIDFKTAGLEIKVDYFLGVDGLSLPMVVLNALLSMLAIIGGWEKNRVKDYMALLLILEAGVMGVFMALDLLFFFLFWEVELAPMFILIGVWGSDVVKHGMPGRIYSAWKFLIYTFFGSVFMLVGILLLYFLNISHGNPATGSMPYFVAHMFNDTITLPIIGVTVGAQLLVFLLIFVAFAVKIPMFPFHTWLPDAHTDAPTEVSVILAGVLLKMGAYGLIRICFTLFPLGVHQFAGWLAVIAVINIIYGAGICLVQKDMKKLIAYSSVSHMGIVLLGVAAAAGSGDVAFRTAALMGATVQMFSHGLITGLLFFCVGVIYDHAHTREIAVFGGVAKKMPMLATLFTFAALASLGLPGLAGFVAEYMVFTSSYQIWQAATIVSVFTMILTAAYLLWMIKRVFYGPFNKKWAWLPDASLREVVPLFVLAAVIVLVGVYPKPLIDVITPSLTHVMQAAVAMIK